jgi:hypothetical protein
MTKLARILVLSTITIVGAGVLIAAKPTNQKWEFKVVAPVQAGGENQEKQFNSMGEDGWQLVDINDGLAYFTRETR